MSGPLAAAGAQSNPTRYGALNMGGEQFTGLYTQRSPYRDAATAYLIKKFYQGSRFDSIWDGFNREISVKLTDVRRPGSGVYNALTFPAGLGMYSFKSVNNSGAEVIRVLYDGTDFNVYDATAGQKSTLLAKSAGAGPMRFLGVNTELFMGDGVDLKTWLYPGGWVASTNVAPGTLINVGAEPGTVQMALGGITMNVVGTSSDSTYIYVYFDPQNIPDQFANLLGVAITFAGLTTATALNGNTYTIPALSAAVMSSTLGLLRIPQAQAAYNETADTGTGTTGTGTTGGSAPGFSSTEFAVVADGGQQWKCYGSAIGAWGLQAPPNAPTLTAENGTRFWQASTVLGQWYAVLDPNQNLQFVISYVAGGVNYKTGKTYPQWVPIPPTTVAETIDGSCVWYNAGAVGAWAPSTAFGGLPINTHTSAILDSNQNLQWVSNGAGGNSGGSAPAWATAVGTTTTDGALTWTCLGPGVALTTASISYAFSTHGIDGSVSTASSLATIQGGILGPGNLSGHAPVEYIAIAGLYAKLNPQIDQIWIWRTAQGQSTLILEDQIPGDRVFTGPSSYTQFGYNELGIPDTSTNGGGALNALIAAPVADANNPPSAGLTGMAWDLVRIWGFVGNKLYYSGGPDTLVGNGNTAWPPLNVIPFVGAIVKIRPVLVENGGIIVYTTSGMQIILGTGTASNPFYPKIYCDKVNLGGYNVEDVMGSVIYLMEANGKVSQITIQYPFNPQSGYSEVGLPIGDQFRKVTTGGISSTLYNPATAFLSWCVANTQDTGMYVADGTVGWFRMSAVSPPESGLLWSPRAGIIGGTSCVQSIETSPGVYQLLIGPNAPPGPILMRDQTGTVFTDNGTAYDAYDTKGVNLLCSTGQVTEVAHISAKSAAVGSRPVVSVLLGEIAASTARPFAQLAVTGPDPATTPRSKSVFSDRYDLAQNGVNSLSDCILVKFDYGTQAAADELYDWGIFASTEEERKEEAAKS